ncbi:MAG: hypothetical protein HGA19_15350 [Oscillochloris sp.]|nr:hypothetical protein [Oscillochloris sp.]
MKSRVHGITGGFALLLIALFFSSSVIVELIGHHQAIAWVKLAILYGLLGLVPAMMITAISGRVLTGKGQGRINVAKQRRMAIIAANGLLVLVPCAFVLQNMAASGNFNTMFYLVQAIELLAGATNITLMSLSIRDGLLLSGKIRQRHELNKHAEGV